MSAVVTSSDVLGHFATSKRTNDHFEAWRMDPARAMVVPAVMGHRSSVVLSASLADVEAVREATEHALGRVRKARVDRVPCIGDWSAPFAATHVLHFIAERDGAIPTWQRFYAVCQEPAFADMLWNPAQRAIEDCRRHGHLDVDGARQAMRWRIGNFYYSFLREQWVHAYLRSRGVYMLQHPLADALFRVDAWFDGAVVSLYIGNSKYRSARGGRKHPASYYLADLRPAPTFIDLELQIRRDYGVVHLPDRDVLDRWIDRLDRRSATHR